MGKQQEYHHRFNIGIHSNCVVLATQMPCSALQHYILVSSTRIVSGRGRKQLSGRHCGGLIDNTNKHLASLTACTRRPTVCFPNQRRITIPKASIVPITPFGYIRYILRVQRKLHFSNSRTSHFSSLTSTLSESIKSQSDSCNRLMQQLLLHVQIPLGVCNSVCYLYPSFPAIACEVLRLARHAPSRIFRLASPRHSRALCARIHARNITKPYMHDVVLEDPLVALGICGCSRVSYLRYEVARGSARHR